MNISTVPIKCKERKTSFGNIRRNTGNTEVLPKRKKNVDQMQNLTISTKIMATYEVFFNIGPLIVLKTRNKTAKTLSKTKNNNNKNNDCLLSLN